MRLIRDIRRTFCSDRVPAHASGHLARRRLRIGACQHRVRFCRARCGASRRRMATWRADGVARRTRRHRRGATHAASTRQAASGRAQRRLDRAAAPAVCARARRSGARPCTPHRHSRLQQCRSAVGLRAGAARAGVRRCVRLDAGARGSRLAATAGCRARGPHVGRAVAQTRPARKCYSRTVAAGVVAAANETCRARTETARRRTRAAGLARSCAHARCAALSIARRHADIAANVDITTASPSASVAYFAAQGIVISVAPCTPMHCSVAKRRA